MKPTYEELEARIEELEKLFNDSKLNESQYKASEEKYRRIFENVQDLFFQADINGIITEISPSVKNYLGFEREELIGTSTKEFYYDIEERNALIKLLLKNGEVNDYEVQFKRKDNQTGYFSFNAHLTKDVHGNVIGTEGTIRDTSDKKKIEKIILASERRFRALVENSYDAIILLDKNGIIKYRTPSSARMSGVKDDEIIGKNFSEFIHADDLDKTIQALSSSLENPEKSQKLLFRRLAPNKKWIYLDSVITNMLNEPSVEAIVVNLQDVTEKIEKEREIKNQLAFQQALIDSIPYPVSIKDPEGKILNCNKAYERDFGTTREYLNGKTVMDLEFLPLDIRKKFHNYNLEIQADISQKSYELSLIYADGNEHSVLYSINGFTLSDGTPGGLIGIIVDISKLKSAQVELLRISKFQQLILDNSSLGIAYARQKQFVWVNQRFADMFQMTIEEVQGQATMIFAKSEEDLVDFYNEYVKLLRGDQLIIVKQLKRKDGTLFWCRFIGKTLDINNPYEGAIWLIEDISERVENEEKIQQFIKDLNEANNKLAESELKFRLISDYCSDWEMFRDPTNKVLYCSPSIENILGYTPEEYIKLSFADVIYPEDFHLAVSAHSRLTQKAENVEPVTFRLIKKNGEIIWAEVYGLPVFASDGTHIGSRTSTHDITKLKTTEFALRKSEAELKEANSTKDKFFSIIAHDLRNPLGNFKAITELLSNEYSSFSEEERILFIDTMKDSSKNIYNLLENLLEWSSSQRGTIPFNPVEINLNYISNITISNLSLAASKKQINIINNIKENIFILADSNMILTIFRNLISNAIKFTHKNGTIIINAREYETIVEIDIKDSGIGMDQALISKLFNIGAKTSRPGTEGEPSTGLGLTLCKEFIERNGGKIWVESELGQGSTFYFTLRLA